MMPIRQNPRSFQKDKSKLPSAVTPVETAIPAFIGYTEKVANSHRNLPVKISSLAEFETHFGKTRNSGFLYHSIRLFYSNGGGDCYIVSVGKSGEVEIESLLAGLEVLENFKGPTLLAIPDSVLLTPAECGELHKAMLSHCSRFRNRFAILDIVNGNKKINAFYNPISDFRENVGNQNLKFGASYYPWVTIKAQKNNFKDLKSVKTNRLNPVLHPKIPNVIKTQTITIPPSGAIAGIYATTDRDRGVWKAPANIEINQILNPAFSLTDEEQQDLNIPKDGSGKSVNAIRAFSGKGTMVWGARTLAGNDNEWRYISVRRFCSMAEESVQKAVGKFTSEPNNETTWITIRAMIESFLNTQWRAGALAGAKPEHAFYVRAGIGQTMTPEDVANGIMNVETGMAVIRPAEFVVLRSSYNMPKS